MSRFRKISIKKTRKKIAYRIWVYWRYTEFYAAKRGFIIPLFRFLSLGRRVYELEPSSVLPDQNKFDVLVKHYKASVERTSSYIEVVELNSDNIAGYIDHLLEIENKSYPEDFRANASIILDRFTDDLYPNPICLLYLRDKRPVAYSLGTNLELYDPFDYGYEIGCHPDYMKFCCFYLENSSVIPEERNSRLSIRVLLEVVIRAKSKGYLAVAAHTRVSNSTDKIGEKLGFTVLMTHKDFLGSHQESAFSYLNMRGLVEKN